MARSTPCSAVLLATGLFLGLAGCRLVDQTTFNADAGKPPMEPPRPVAAAPPAAPSALLRIPLTPEPDWAIPLRQAVSAARQRKATVEFDVYAAVPVLSTPADQVAEVQAAGEPAARVAQAIQNEGVPATRVHLMAGLSLAWPAVKSVSSFAEAPSPATAAAPRFDLASQRSGLLFLLATTVAWGLNWPLMKFLIAEWPPLSNRALSGIIAGVAAFGLAVLRRMRCAPPPARCRCWCCCRS